MRRYAKLSTLDSDNLKAIFNFFFDRCDKVNIYFPNTSKDTPNKAMTDFKNDFLSATHIIENPNELGDLEDNLEEKEGFSMIIASLTEKVKLLLLEMNSEMHLNLGLIAKDKVVFYMGDTDECVIEADENSEIFNAPLFKDFKII